MTLPHISLPQPPPRPVPCPTACCESRKCHPHSRRCSTIDTAIARRSSSVRARRKPLMGARGKANPISNAKCSSTLHPATRPCAGSFMLAAEVYCSRSVLSRQSCHRQAKPVSTPKIRWETLLERHRHISRIGVSHAARSPVLERLPQALPRLLPHCVVPGLILQRAGELPADQ